MNEMTTPLEPTGKLPIKFDLTFSLIGMWFWIYTLFTAFRATDIYLTHIMKGIN